ncbi:hypothetical protein [Halostagnicola kamekurae]|uniref:Uncharacterized protein n=1 Tax=Halostagnicola kamekurae TaxID=619731 RepID=A0A1I6TU58_9EURY|nr:hypothetical protein [Halostagnicola kamekurae]SFS92517.1 hypothetical protein SAMN04488556_3419 [Halostagnicola kamekurae]
MTNDTSLGTRLKAELTKDFTVSVVAVLMALLTIYPLYRIGVSFAASFLLLLAIAANIPHAYEQYWPISYSGGAAVVWTISAALITSGVLIGAYQLALSFVESPYAGIIAYFVTGVVQYGIAALFMRVYQTS